MPYIKNERRPEARVAPQTPGELNYAISSACAFYLEANGFQYKTLNDILGALEGAKLEFYRRIAVSYEDGKLKQNGDVYYNGLVDLNG
jgi:hypothetical protein